MSGAKSLKPGFFQGRRLLNLDSEADDVIYIGCAGGCDTTLTWEFATAPVEPGSDTCCISVSGLRGGHSGCDIHENRGSAICLMARTMAKYRLPNLRLVEIAAGSLRNALPREARLVINGPAGTISKLAESASVIQEAAVNETSEPNVRIEVSKADVPAAAISADDTSTLINALTALPHGVFDLHPVIDGLVQTSNNVATVASSPITNGHMRVTVATLSRSSSRTRMNVVLGQIAAVGRLAGASITTGNEYPGWDPNENSPLLKTCARLYEELFSHPANVTAIHAGLECGIIGERIGGMDMVSFGPRIEGAHSPDERIWVKSVQKSWKYLRAVLAELAKS
jgi:dipeptidase D